MAFNLAGAVTGLAQGVEQNRDSSLRRQQARQQLMEGALRIQQMQSALDQSKQALKSKAAQAGFLGGDAAGSFGQPQGAAQPQPGARPQQAPPQQAAPQPPVPGQPSVPMAPRGIRNNNPGNLTPLPNGQKWDGQTGVDKGGDDTFASPAAGDRAAGINLQNQQKLHGLNTVQGIIAKYAPQKAGNNTANYTAYVAKALGVRPDQPINLQDPQTLQKFKQAVYQFENGPGMMPSGSGAQKPAQTPQPQSQQGVQAGAQQTPQQAPDFSPEAMVRYKHNLFAQLAKANPNADPSTILDATNDLVESLGKVAALQKPQAGVVIQEGREQTQRDIAQNRNQTTEDVADKKIDASTANTDKRIAASKEIASTKAGAGAASPANQKQIDALKKDKGVQLAAQVYARTGKMPSMGYGASTNLRRQAVMEAAADIVGAQPGGLGGAVANQAETHAQTANLSNLAKMRGSVSQLEGTASKEGDLVLSLMNKGAGGGLPVINKWIQGSRAGLGDPNVSAFDGAITSFKNEYAKVMSGGSASGGGASTDSARNEADRLINRNQSPAQIRKNIETMKKSMENRRQALQDAYDKAKVELSGSSTAGWSVVSVK
jgi:hypothetical protein